MSYLTYNADRILNPGPDDSLESNASWFIRFLYGMDWEEFGRRYTIEQWNTVAENLIAGAVGSDSIPQAYMDKYVMLGCLSNVPPDYQPGLSSVLNAQKVYDPASFEEALATLDDYQLSEVLTILENNGSDPFHILVHEGTSAYRDYKSTSEFYLNEGLLQQPRLAGKSIYVYFNLEEDGLRAYGKKITREHLNDNNEWEYVCTYDDLLATYPREVGVLANQKLVEYANSWIGYGAPVDANLIDEGFIGEDWFCLVTRDETIQDVQVHCIFYNDGGTWIEIPANNGGLYIDGVNYGSGERGFCFPLYGACVVSKDIAFLSYYSKFLWTEELGFTKPYVYRTEDGGATWERLDITLPDYFLPSNSGRICVPLCPFFRGNHGIMLLNGLNDYELAWLESHDLGKTWEFRFDRLSDYPAE